MYFTRLKIRWSLEVAQCSVFVDIVLETEQSKAQLGCTTSATITGGWKPDGRCKTLVTVNLLYLYKYKCVISNKD